jgi:cytidylate kinase
MIPAPDAVIIETDNLSIEQVLMQLENLIIAGQTAGQIENER